jgi:cobalt-precorrin 5A hydrolase / precorrin-3B C17-methyltransferase
VKPAVVVLSSAAMPLARRIADALGGQTHGPRPRAIDADVSFDGATEHLRALFAAGRPVVALMAAGAVIRILAPLLADKRAEPPVVAVAEDGACAVPLLGGHHGANDLARRVATVAGGRRPAAGLAAGKP